MIPLGPRPSFDEFGAWTLAPRSTWPQASIVLDGQPGDNRKRLRGEAPLAPGVYGMVDGEGELIYVGQSRSLRNRLLSYFAGSAPPKARRIIAHTRRLVWETAPDELAAQVRELELIRRWRPRFNVRGQPNRRRPTYVVIGRAPASRVYLAAVPAKGDTSVFGPVRASRQCHRAVHALNDHFQLCTCGQKDSTRLAGQRELFPSESTVRCLRHDLGNCLAPCLPGNSRAQYAERVLAAKKFLRGTDLSALSRLEEAMQTAAAAQCYEQAAVYRDTREALERLQTQLERFRAAERQYSFIYVVQSRDGRRSWYLIQRGQIHAVIDEPRDRLPAEECLAMMERTYTGRTLPATGATREDAEMTLLVATWFASRPAELQHTLSPAAARERLRAAVGR